MSEPNLTDWISALGGFISAVAALAAVGLTGKQLTAIVKQLRQGSFAALMSLEVEMNNRKQRVDDAVHELHKSLKLKEKGSEDGAEAADRDVSHLETCIENWLNLVDRFAFCFRKKILKEKDFKQEYIRYFGKLIEAFPEKFKEGTVFDNITYICKRWKIKLPE